MHLRNRHFQSPGIPTVPNKVEDPREEVTETLSCSVSGVTDVEAVLSEADDRSRISAAAAIVSAVADHLAKSESSSYITEHDNCLLYTSPSPRDQRGSRMPSSA